MVSRSKRSSNVKSVTGQDIVTTARKLTEQFRSKGSIPWFRGHSSRFWALRPNRRPTSWLRFATTQESIPQMPSDASSNVSAANAPSSVIPLRH